MVLSIRSALINKNNNEGTKNVVFWKNIKRLSLEISPFLDTHNLKVSLANILLIFFLDSITWHHSCTSLVVIFRSGKSSFISSTTRNTADSTNSKQPQSYTPLFFHGRIPKRIYIFYTLALFFFAAHTYKEVTDHKIIQFDAKKQLRC